MGIDGVVVSRCCRRGIVGNVVEVDHGVPGDYVKLLWGDVFRGSSLEVLGFLLHFEVVCCVVGKWGLELSRGKRTVVILDVFALVFPASDEGWVEDGSGSESEGNSRFIW